MINVKKVLLGSLVVLGCTVGGAVQAANLATVTVVNETSAEAVYGYEYLFGSVNPLPTNILQNSSIRFVHTSGSDIASGMRFTYAVGSKKCRFSASHLVEMHLGGYLPSCKKDAVSIGSSPATCTATLVGADSNLPFNYTVKFSIK